MNEIKEKSLDEDVDIDLGDVQVYEIGYHLLPNIGDAGANEEVLGMHALIKKNEGNIISEGTPEIKELTYEMTKRVETRNLKYNKAYFGWIKFEIDRSKILEIKNKIENLQNVLRFLIIRTVKENTIYTPKVAVFKKEVSKDVIDADTDVEKIVASEADIDKSIDQLLVNEN